MDIYAAESNVNHYQRGLVCQIFVSLMAFHLELFSPNESFRSGRQISWRRGLKWSGLGV
jgi:hypothetical protein